ncbi:MAG: MBL fold metallo-hydrolase [Proteobacteria bacterium]|nr:MBL fold metallo-hydrolase [Pseudomonadota bacterium]
MNKLHKLLFFSIFPILHTSSIAVAQTFDEVEINVYPVAGQVYYIEGRGGNIGLFVGADGVFLVDDQFAPLTDKIVAAIRPLSDKPVRFIVNTHLHPDHTGGNENFGKMGALIFGHDNVRHQMEISAYTQEPPLITYSQDVSFHINGETVHVFKTPDAHTNGDSYIYFKGSNVIHAGDVYRTTSYPYIDINNGGSFLGTIKALELLVDVSDDDTKIIPGHGVISGTGEVQAFLDMLLVIRDRVKVSIKAGMSLEETQAAGLTKEYDERWESGRRIGSSAALIGAAYADLMN